jgi:hypothetical protein
VAVIFISRSGASLNGAGFARRARETVEIGVFMAREPPYRALLTSGAVAQGATCLSGGFAVHYSASGQTPGLLAFETVVESTCYRVNRFRPDFAPKVSHMHGKNHKRDCNKSSSTGLI